MSTTINLLPADVILKFKKGDTVRFGFWMEDAYDQVLDLSGYTASSKIRTAYGSSGTLIATFTCTITAPTLTDKASIQEGLTDHYLVLCTLSPSTSAAITQTEGVFDVELTAPDTTVTSICRGPVVMKDEATF